MEEHLISVVEKNAVQLRAASTKSELRELVAMVEEEFCTRVGRRDDEAMQALWLSLVKFSIADTKVELSILMAAKLKLVQLALVLSSTLQRESKVSQPLALAYASNYFRARPARDPLEAISSTTEPLLFTDYESLLDFRMSSCEWDKAFDLVKQQHGHESSLNERVVYYHRAQFNEAEEDFVGALADYELAVARPSDLVRVIMKQHLDGSLEVLQSYCKGNTAVSNYWNEFIFENSSGTISKDTQVIPDSIRQYVDDDSNEKWLDRQRIDSLAAVVSHSNAETVQRLARESIKYRQTNDLNRALSIELLLNQMDTLVDGLPNFVDPARCLLIYTSWTDHRHLANFLTSNPSIRSLSDKRRATKPGVQAGNALFIACIKLGLIDDALEELARHGALADNTLAEALELLQSRIDDKGNKALDYIDPELKSATLTKLDSLLNDNQSLTTAVISIVIFSATIYLIKLERTTAANKLANLLKLEKMFQKLSHYLDEYDFIPSDTFVRSTGGLMAVAREQLDAISDSEIIRDTLRLLVERGAHRSLMQGCYKNAAKLYNLIEDNINAVKSLMRLGDVEVVIKYSLLVRDVTVNRLTVNYLKHLNADPSTIEDFIAKSRA